MVISVASFPCRRHVAI